MRNNAVGVRAERLTAILSVPMSNNETVKIGDPTAAKLAATLDDLLEQTLDKHVMVGCHVPAIQFDHFLELIDGLDVSFNGRRVLDFGCGAHRPLSNALIYYLCGAENVTAIDVDDIFDIGSVASGLVAQCAQIVFGDAFEFGRLRVERKEVLERLSRVNLKALRCGDIYRGLPEEIQWRQTYYEHLPHSMKQYDILIANTVFEHVVDVYGTLCELRKNISADGIAVIVIDYKDHRAYAGTTQSYYHYLIDDGDHIPGYINKMRHTEFVTAAQRAGFAVVREILEPMQPTEAERERFLPKYAALSEQDLTTSGARILFKPI